jgi:hypothetical protein
VSANIVAAIGGLKQGDFVEVVYRGFVTEEQGRTPNTLRITCDDGFMDHYHATDVWDIKVLKRAPIPEPPIGSIIRCEGCGSRHHRVTRKDGVVPDPTYCWVSEDNGTFSPWTVLNEDSSCGELVVVFTP